ncbi:MAG: hypothetical protein V2I31_14005 [Mariniphaga sp.]|jgi:hypothetical protein|nr:hypothetical protein [Mariniphaga sp.]
MCIPEIPKINIMAFEVSVFLENKIAHFEGITNILKQEQINIRSLTLNNILHGWGVLNLLVDQPEKAYQALTEKGNSVALREVIALEMEDETGGLDELLMKISRVGIHIENAYTRLISQTNMAILVLDVPDVIEAKKLLEQNQIPILNDQMVYGK